MKNQKIEITKVILWDCDDNSDDLVINVMVKLSLSNLKHFRETMKRQYSRNVSFIYKSI